MSENYKKPTNRSPKDWASTFTKSYPRAAKLSLRRSPNEELDDFEDNIQDAYVRLLERRPDAEALENPESYALKTIQNVCFDRFNRRSRLRAENTVYLDAQRAGEDEHRVIELRDPRRGPELDAEIKIDNEKRLRILASHCSDLTKREQDLLALHLQGLSNEQIAMAWGEDVKVIRADMNAVLVKIRYRVKHSRGK